MPVKRPTAACKETCVNLRRGWAGSRRTCPTGLVNIYIYIYIYIDIDIDIDIYILDPQLAQRFL
jgi:hypothetical protein